jgi:hypothetical protein
MIAIFILTCGLDAPLNLSGATLQVITPQIK